MTATFDELVGEHRPAVFAQCYRMLGSLADAEDAVQETFLRAWRGLDRFEGRSSLRTWLYTIASNVCLRMLERRPPRQLPLDVSGPAYVGEEPGRTILDAPWLQPCPDSLLALDDVSPEARYTRRESVELAFVAALQELVPRQRAALILRDVLGFSAKETAEALETTVPAANSALQRARAVLDARTPDRTQEQTLGELGDARVRELVQRYVTALEGGDVDTVMALLVEDAVWSMPPMSTWYRGREAVTRFLVDWPLSQRWRHVPVGLNGQAAVGCYMQDEDGVFRLHALDVLTLDGDRIASVTAFLDADVLRRVGLDPVR